MSQDEEGIKLIFIITVDNHENISFISKLVEIIVALMNSFSLLY